MSACRHVRPRRCCPACREAYTAHYGPEKGARRFAEALAVWRPRRKRRRAVEP